MIKKADIIIPIHNNASSLPELVRRIHNSLYQSDISYNLIFVDDYSTDDTQKILRRLSRQYPITIIPKQGPPGKALSVFEGAVVTTSEYLVIIDGDLNYPPEVIPQMLAQIPQHGLVIAHRRTNSETPPQSFISKTKQAIFGRWLLNLKYDSRSGLKVFRREFLQHLDPGRMGAWVLDEPLITTALDLGFTVGRVDIDADPGLIGKSRSGLFASAVRAGKTAFYSGLHRRRIFQIDPVYSSSSVGAGLVHNRHRYITHSRLPSHLSAVKILTAWQKFAALMILGILVTGLFLDLKLTVTLFLGVLSFIYLLDVVFSFSIIYKSLHSPPEYRFTPDELSKLDKKYLPVYSVLVPLYHEAKVLPAFLDSISQMDWPKNKLDVMLLLEEDDQETLAVANTLALPGYVRVIVVPHSFPKTKPKACNYGLQFAKGEYVVVYDAEDRPDPQQLKKAYLGFQSAPAKTACLQGKLNYFNPKDNLLTRLFTAEYSLWFDVVLPGLQSINTTIPLGGTSNHFKTRVLLDLHGWDAFNVTEDCDLGTRLFKAGYKTAIVDSTTLEEANSKIGNWIRQRSRWIKGYIQTFLVHNRHPLEFLRQHGWHALIFQLIIGLRISFMIINPILWATTIAYFTAYRFVGPAIESVYPAPVFYMAGFAAVFGNFMFLFNYMIGCAKTGHWNLIKYVYLIPVYWLMISIAAVKAFYQLIVKPHYWEKTHHGLNLKTLVTEIPVPKEAKPATRAPAYRWLSNFFSNAHVQSGTVLVIATFLANFLNFVYNAYLARKVSIEEFGLISLIGSFFSITQFFTSSLSKTVTHRSAYLMGKFHQPVKIFWQYIRGKSFLVSILALILWFLAIPVMLPLFKTNNYLAFALFSPVWIIGMLGAVDKGFLSGNFRFKSIAVMTVIEAVAKLLVTVLFVNFRLHAWVYAAIPISAFLSFLGSWLLVSRIKETGPAPEDSVAYYFPKKFFLTGILNRLSSLAFMSLDLVIVKLFMSPVLAGQYALLSLVGKMVYLIGSVPSQFTIPLVSHAEGAGKNSKVTFYRILAIISLSTLLGYLAVGEFGYLTVPILFGAKAIPIVGYLPKYTLAIAAFAIASEIITYHQIRRHYLFPAFGFLIGMIQIWVLSRYHSDLNMVVNIMFEIGIVLLLVILLFHLVYSQAVSIWRNILDAVNIFITRVNGVHRPSGDNLRILIFNWRDIRHIWAGGAEVYLHEIARRWVKMGHQVTLFCGNDGNNPSEEIIDGVRIFRRGGFFTVYFWAAIYYLFKLRGHFDVIIDSENGIPFFTPLYSYNVPKFLLVHHVHQNVFRQHLKFPLRNIAIFLESTVMPNIYKNNQVITVSDSSKKDLLELGVGVKSNISIVNPGVDLTKFAPAAKTSYPSFIYLGRIRPYKNIDIAIKAFARVHEIYPAARLSIAGWGEGISGLKRLVAELKLENSVKFLKRVSEKEKVRLLASSWVMLQPSSFEGWGITVIEANASGTPVIASKVIGLSDSVVDQQTGVLVSKKNITEMENAMIDLITHSSKLRKLSQNALKWARNFDWDIQSYRALLVINTYNSKETIDIRKKAYVERSTRA